METVNWRYLLSVVDGHDLGLSTSLSLPFEAVYADGVDCHLLIDPRTNEARYTG